MNRIDPLLFWNRLDLMLLHKGITYKSLAESAGIEYRSINTQRTRHSLPKVEQIAAMATSLKTTIEFLITGDQVGGYLPPRIKEIANKCLTAPEEDILLIERVLRISKATHSQVL